MMPVFLHGGSVCPLEVLAALSGLGSFWAVGVYLVALLRARVSSKRG